MEVEDIDASVFLGPEPTNEELGRAVECAFAASRFVRPGDPDFEATFRSSPEKHRRYVQTLLDAAGVRTQKALFSGSRLVRLSRQDGTVTVTPLRRVRAATWEGLAGVEPLRLPAAAPDDALGRAVREGLARAR